MDCNQVTITEQTEMNSCYSMKITSNHHIQTHTHYICWIERTMESISWDVTLSELNRYDCHKLFTTRLFEIHQYRSYRYITYKLFRNAYVFRVGWTVCLKWESERLTWIISCYPMVNSPQLKQCYQSIWLWCDRWMIWLEIHSELCKMVWSEWCNTIPNTIHITTYSFLLQLGCIHYH